MGRRKSAVRSVLKQAGVKRLMDIIGKRFEFKPNLHSEYLKRFESFVFGGRIAAYRVYGLGKPSETVYLDVDKIMEPLDVLRPNEPPFEVSRMSFVFGEGEWFMNTVSKGDGDSLIMGFDGRMTFE